MSPSVDLPSDQLSSRRRRLRGYTIAMPRSTRGKTSGGALAAALLALLSTAHAAPSAQAVAIAPIVERRKAVLSDSDVLKIAEKVPADLIILIGVTMFIAFLCLLLAIVNVRHPRLRSSRIAEERAQARSDLRVRGAGQHYVIDRKQSRRNAGATNSTVTAASQLTADSKMHLISPQMQQSPTMEQYRRPTVLASGSEAAAGPVIAGPRVADGRSSRAARGYSFYNKQDMLISGSHASRPNGSRLAAQRSQRSLNTEQTSALLLPPMPRRQTDGSSDASSTVGGSSLLGGSSINGGLMGPRPLPPHARLPRLRQPSDRNGFVPSHRVSSTTVGRGSVVNMNRSYDKPWRTELPVPPQLIDPAYDGRSNGVTTPRSKLPGRYDLHRTMTDPRDNISNSRRNSFALNNNGSPVRAPSYFDGSGSEGHSHEGGGKGSPSSPSLQQHPLLPYSSQLPRTRPLALYDLEAEAEAYPSNHLTSLLEDDGAQRAAKRSWNAYS